MPLFSTRLTGKGKTMEMRDIKKLGKGLIFTGLLLLGGDAVAWAAQAQPGLDIPVKRIALFSSGVGFFEHSGEVYGPVGMTLPFAAEAVDDVLKSFTVHDPASTAPLLSYPSEDTLERTLKSLSVDLSGNPGIPEILAGLRGAELEAAAPEKIRGRIVSVETRQMGGKNGTSTEYFVSLSTDAGIQTLPLKDIAAFRFADPQVGRDLNRALDLILHSRDTRTRSLRLDLPGERKRAVSFAYVIPAPVWKVSYRLDLDDGELQGWAIVDNAGDTDWENVELSLVAGRPVSFIQHLYQPYYLSRPVLPLAIAGYAEAQTYTSGYHVPESEVAMDEDAKEMVMAKAAVPAPAAPRQRQNRSMMNARGMGLRQQAYETAQAAPAGGEQFSFTISKPVTLLRRQSAMLPLVQAGIDAKKRSVFSGAKAMAAPGTHPALCVELANTTGMKLPAGPVTVFDGGGYAGDALMEFFPEKEKRLIAFGEDLAVTGAVMAKTSSITGQATISGGLLRQTWRMSRHTVYTLKNASASARDIIIEHPIEKDAKLTQPASVQERTASEYRFPLALGAGQEKTLEVREERPMAESLALVQLDTEALFAYSTSGEMPEPVRRALARALEYKKGIDAVERQLAEGLTRRDEYLAGQDRIRKNIEAAGRDSSQGKDYLKRLSDTDAAIDRLDAEITRNRKEAGEREKAYEAYLSSLNL